MKIIITNTIFFLFKKLIFAYSWKNYFTEYLSKRKRENIRID